MAERPIILFSTPTTSAKSKRSGGSPSIQYPTHSRQVNRLQPKMASLQNALLTLQQSTAGIESERTLVFEVVGSTNDFYTAVRKWGEDAEWIFDIPTEVSATDDFYEYKEDKETKEHTRRDDKSVIGGKIYCILTNARALQEMLQLWERFKSDPNTKFPTGKAGLKHIFTCLSDVHIWGYTERIEETGILDAWKEDLQDPDLGSVKCEIELFFRKSPETRQQREADLSTKITSLGGTVLSSTVITEIAYHAVLADLPRNAIEQIIKKDANVSLLTAEQIMFFRPTGQAVFLPDGVDVSKPITLPSADNIINEPLVALFDGLPQENHPYMSNRLIIDDPDNYASQYTVSDRKHGTSMASLISLGDLSDIIQQSTYRVYVRPIMKPVRGLIDVREEIPDDILLVDKIHEAVRRLFVPIAGAVAPTIKVINLSIGISYRQFDRSMSPLARLLDWLSYTYRVLFVVSAGNHNIDLDVGLSFADFTALNFDDRDKSIIKWIHDNTRKLRLLSPSESMNALTVGATFDDESHFIENARQTLPCTKGTVNPISAVGKGLNNSIKPDIVFPGGRKSITENFRKPDLFSWALTQNEPGTQSAAPFTPGSSVKTAFTFGTSNAAALISHEASRCYDALLEVFEEAKRELPTAYVALLLKAMLVHGAEWGALKDKLTQTLGLTTRNQYPDVLHRFIGYGLPDIDRAIECAKKRITLIGYGELRDGEAHLYELPLPFDFNREIITRRLTATLANFTPIVPSRQDYRSAQLWFTVEKGKKHLLDSRVDASDKAVARGSVQHEIFENTKIVAWGEDDGGIQIKVNCRAVADEHLSVAIPYALMVSFEIKSDIDIDVYAKVAEKVRPRIQIQPMAEERGEE